MKESAKILGNILCAVLASLSHRPVCSLGAGEVGGPLGQSGELHE